MRKIHVRITKIDKGDKDLTLLNLREELVNFLYRDTVASATKSDLLFYVLIFFIYCKSGKKTLLELVMTEALPKLDNLNQAFAELKNRIRPGVYRRLVLKHGLENIFKSDVFFILIEAVLNIDEIEQKYSSYFSKNIDLKNEIASIRKKYFKRTVQVFQAFQASEIVDEREGWNGSTLDLSKSVYRTVRMRNSRNLDLNLQKYTSVNTVKSESPVDFSFLQCVPPELTFDLWDKFHLADYAKAFIGEAVTRVRDTINLKIDLGDIIALWLTWKYAPRGSSDGQKDERKQQLDALVNDVDNQKLLRELGDTMVNSILQADTRREAEIKRLNTRLKRLETLNKDDLKESEEERRLRKRVAELENIKYEAEEIDD